MLKSVRERTYLCAGELATVSDKAEHVSVDGVDTNNEDLTDREQLKAQGGSRPEER